MILIATRLVWFAAKSRARTRTTFNGGALAKLIASDDIGEDMRLIMRAAHEASLPGSWTWNAESLQLTITFEDEATDDVNRVFEHWRDKIGGPRKRLTADRIGLIRRWLKHYTCDELIMALNGFAASRWHRERDIVSLRVAFKSSDQIDRFIGTKAAPDSSLRSRAKQSRG